VNEGKRLVAVGSAEQRAANLRFPSENFGAMEPQGQDDIRGGVSNSGCGADQTGSEDEARELREENGEIHKHSGGFGPEAPIVYSTGKSRGKAFPLPPMRAAELEVKLGTEVWRGNLAGAWSWCSPGIAADLFR
jgi:hypothetical protein